MHAVYTWTLRNGERSTLKYPHLYHTLTKNPQDHKVTPAKQTNKQTQQPKSFLVVLADTWLFHKKKTTGKTF